MGQGELPYDLFFKTLLDTGFDGWISYEMCCPVRGGGAIENIEQCQRGGCGLPDGASTGDPGGRDDLGEEPGGDRRGRTFT